MTRDVDWSAAWQTAWKAHPASAWLHYQLGIYADWLRHGDGQPVRRALKTDAFDEACGLEPLASALPGAARVYMDVSPRIVAEARARRPGARLACATDVRRLAFRPGTFDLVFSPSSLDHFRDVRDIVVALGELRSALRPGGRLLLTLDNPRNPVLGVRTALHRATGPLGGLIPFPMGRTLSLRRLVGAAEAAGFEIVRAGYVVHAPRVACLWIAEWAARRDRRALGVRLARAFRTLDRLLGALPSRTFTGQYVVIDCRARDAGQCERNRTTRL